RLHIQKLDGGCKLHTIETGSCRLRSSQKLPSSLGVLNRLASLQHLQDVFFARLEFGRDGLRCSCRSFRSNLKPALLRESPERVTRGFCDSGKVRIELIVPRLPHDLRSNFRQFHL